MAFPAVTPQAATECHLGASAAFNQQQGMQGRCSRPWLANAMILAELKPHIEQAAAAVQFNPWHFPQLHPKLQQNAIWGPALLLISNKACRDNVQDLGWSMQ